MKKNLKMLSENNTMLVIHKANGETTILMHPDLPDRCKPEDCKVYHIEHIRKTKPWRKREC